MFHKTSIQCLAAIAVLTIAVAAQAVVVPIVDVYGHNEKANYAGTITDMIIGSGMNGYNYPTEPPETWPDGEGDPSTWTATTNGYQNEWQSGDLLGDGEEGEDVPTNSKIGWTVFDLGSATAGLDAFYIWNMRENNARAVNTYNVYHASTPSVAVTHGPTGNTSIDYDFASGGWTLLNAGGPLSLTWRNTDGANPNAVLDLGGITAQYIAVEILTNGVGTTGDGTRTGLAEVGVTASDVPDQAGDFNGDGAVEAADLALLLGNWGGSIQPGDWTTNWDSFVDANELADLLGNWGAGLDSVPVLDAAALNAIPEPATMTLLALSSLAAMRRRRS